MVKRNRTFAKFLEATLSKFQQTETKKAPRLLTHSAQSRSRQTADSRCMWLTENFFFSFDSSLFQDLCVIFMLAHNFPLYLVVPFQVKPLSVQKKKSFDLMDKGSVMSGRFPLRGTSLFSYLYTLHLGKDLLSFLILMLLT